jgi:hypothetical protein
MRLAEWGRLCVVVGAGKLWCWQQPHLATTLLLLRVGWGRGRDLRQGVHSVGCCDGRTGTWLSPLVLPNCPYGGLSCPAPVHSDTLPGGYRATSVSLSLCVVCPSPVHPAATHAVACSGATTRRAHTHTHRLRGRHRAPHQVCCVGHRQVCLTLDTHTGRACSGPCLFPTSLHTACGVLARQAGAVSCVSKGAPGAGPYLFPTHPTEPVECSLWWR